jgi:hypothetical protein
MPERSMTPREHREAAARLLSINPDSRAADLHLVVARIKEGDRRFLGCPWLRDAPSLMPGDTQP